MNTIDFRPSYSNNIGFGRFVESTLDSNTSTQSYPPYNIENLADHKYAITLALAGYDKKNLSIQLENGVLTVRGKKMKTANASAFVHEGIANRSFSRTFNLTDYVEVRSASLANGMLTINLVKNVPEALLPKSIPIEST